MFVTEGSRFKDFPGTIFGTLPYNFTRRAFLNHGRKLPSQFSNIGSYQMNRINRFAIAFVAASLLAAPAVYAAPASISSPVHAMFGKTKSNTVKLNLKNESAAPLDVKVGDKVMTLEPGKPVTLNLEVGTRIVSESNTPTHPEGSLIEQVIKDHNGATIVIR
jgi:hypothetical protein